MQTNYDFLNLIKSLRLIFFLSTWDKYWGLFSEIDVVEFLISFSEIALSESGSDSFLVSTSLTLLTVSNVLIKLLYQIYFKN